jgi:alkaline phosphatase D
VILWTRLAPDPVAVAGGITVDSTVSWEIATDVAFANVAQSGTASALVANGHAVHVTVNALNPDTYYYYRFAWSGSYSRIGRTKTAPIGATAGARFAFISCQKVNEGWYAAFRQMLCENLDFVVHLGDYIYESSGTTAWPANLQTNPVDLPTYRARYMLYRGDPNLRRLHAAVPWIVTWDDHEFRNDYDGNTGTTQRRRDAYRAYYESMPLRLPAGLPADYHDMPIYRGFQFGNLLDLLVLDTRQYRSDPSTCNATVQNGVTVPTTTTTVGATGACLTTDRHAASRSMLGAAQKTWLKNSLLTSTTAWRSIANQQIMADLQTGGLPGTVQAVAGVDPSVGLATAWQGYAAERKELMDHIAANGIRNVVVLSGDSHRTAVSHLKSDFQTPGSPIVATEFAGPSITSSNYEFDDPTEPGLISDANLQANADRNQQLAGYATWRHLRFSQPSQHGYVVCDVTPSAWKTTYMLMTDQMLGQSAFATAEATAQIEFTVSSGDPTLRVTGGPALANPLPDV